jgi:glycine/D-amino acid oxidase-like deaminating enzyme
VEHDFFEAVLWPVLAARVPAFEAIRPGRAWAGHYDMNLFDHNAIVGPVPVERLLVAVGFSGHGLQQSPAVGRGLSELVAFGGYRSLDLSPLGYARIARGEKVDEKNVV